MLHDTTDFSFKRQERTAIGLLRQLPTQSACGTQVVAGGVLLPSRLVVTTGGGPLGLGTITGWTRKRFKGTDALKRKIHPPRMPLETKESIRWLEHLPHFMALEGAPQRCLPMGDRESDSYEVFGLAQKQRTQFLVRPWVDRVAGDGTTLISKFLSQAPVKGHP